MARGLDRLINRIAATGMQRAHQMYESRRLKAGVKEVLIAPLEIEVTRCGLG